MPSTAHDYSDSENESHSPLLERRGSSVSGVFTREASVESRPPAANAHPLRVTLRPTLTHLMNDQTATTSQIPSSERSSLSPPPPITLKLGMLPKNNPAYSSSENEDAGPPSKKAKKSTKATKPKSKPSSSTSTPVQPIHMKKYDWLQPSAASASHSGPPEREREHEKKTPKVTGWPPGEENETPTVVVEHEEVSPEGSKRKSHKKRPENLPAGPGKNWRKGLKKGMGIPWKDGAALGSTHSTPYQTPGHGTPYSADGSPEPDNHEPIPIHVAMPSVPRGASPPFVAADPIKLGFPVFSKPIAAPIIVQSPFPKVTSYFATLDVARPFKKERVARWTHSDRTIAGVGGGRLKFKSWTQGPPSDLSYILQAEREAREQAKKAAKAIANANIPVLPEPTWTSPSDRPTLPHTQSFEGNEEEFPNSEYGDNDDRESVGATPSLKGKGGGGVKGKGKGRKSKLANEIVVAGENSPS
ncbi:hypothetical protein P7C73_g2670, partial [Tremellales sp. Uapishka_1]